MSEPDGPSKFWPRRRRAIGMLLTALAVAAAVAALRSASTAAQATVIPPSSCDTASEISSLTTPGAPSGFGLRLYGDPASGERGFQLYFNPRGTPNAAAPTDTVSDPCNNVAGYEVLYSTNQTALSNLLNTAANEENPSAANVTEVERSVSLSASGRSYLTGNVLGLTTNTTYYVAMRVNFQKPCSTTGNDAVPSGCGSVRGAWSSIVSKQLPTPALSLNQGIDNQTIAPGTTFDFGIPTDAFTNTSGWKMTYRATRVDQNGNTITKDTRRVLLPDWITDYPGRQEDRFNLIGNQGLTRFKGNVPVDSVGTTLYVWVLASAAHGYHFATDTFEINVVNNDPVLGTLDNQTMTVGKASSFNISYAGNGYDPDGHILYWDATDSEGWISGVLEKVDGIDIWATPESVGTSTVTVTVDDRVCKSYNDSGDCTGGTGTATTTFTITSENKAPITLGNLQDWTPKIRSWRQYKFDASTVFSDPDGHYLTYTVTETPSWISSAVRGVIINFNEIKISGQAPDTDHYTAKINATDDYGGTVSLTLDIYPTTIWTASRVQVGGL